MHEPASPSDSREGSQRDFQERLVGRFAPDAVRFALPLLLVGGVALGAGWRSAGVAFWGLGLCVALFFRNPPRKLPAGPGLVLSPADGKVIEVGEIETQEGRKALRVGIFLSVFDVHINRAPVAGRVLALERGGDRYLAAFNREAETRNVRLAMTLETRDGRRVRVVQISGLIARRIVCQPKIGEWLERGVRYGLIRFGSRTDVVLPLGSRARVGVGERVRGGESIVAELPPAGPVEAAASPTGGTA